MKVVVQRVSKASVTVNDKVISEINQGFMLLVGLNKSDNLDTVKYVARKVANLRIFSDENNMINLSIKDVKGEILSISQFTLYGDTKKSNRPSFTHAMNYIEAEKIYQQFNEILRNEYDIEVQEGVFGADMDISLVNQGPVTIIIEKNN